MRAVASQCTWQHPLKVIGDLSVQKGKLAACKWPDTSLLHNPNGEKVNVSVITEKKKDNRSNKIQNLQDNYFYTIQRHSQ